MKYEEKILKRFNEITSLGDKVLATRHSPPDGVMGSARVDQEITLQWISSAQNLINRIFGADSPHSENIKNEIKNYVAHNNALRIHGIVKSAKDDYETETLFDLKELITADLFDDFLEQAEILLTAKYHQPAAVIIGAVLEDGLRKLCENNNITLLAKPKIDSMNVDLAKENVYTKLTQKNITAHADLRNNAAHGRWDEFTEDDVKEFLQWTRRFMSQHF